MDYSRFYEFLRKCKINYARFKIKKNKKNEDYTSTDKGKHRKLNKTITRLIGLTKLKEAEKESTFSLMTNQICNIERI
jgi:hypothetical protein